MKNPARKYFNIGKIYQIRKSMKVFFYLPANILKEFRANRPTIGIPSMKLEAEIKMDMEDYLPPLCLLRNA